MEVLLVDCMITFFFGVFSDGLVFRSKKYLGCFVQLVCCVRPNKVTELAPIIDITCSC